MTKSDLHVGNTFFSTFLIFGDLKTFSKNGLFPIFDFQPWGGFPYRSRVETCNRYRSIDLVELSKNIYNNIGSKRTQTQKTTKKRQNRWNLLHFETQISPKLNVSKNTLRHFSGSPTYVEHAGVKKFGTNAIVNPIFELKKAICIVSRNFLCFGRYVFIFFSEVRSDVRAFIGTHVAGEQNAGVESALETTVFSIFVLKIAKTIL